MNDNDIKKCIKHGFCWSSCGDKPETIPTHYYTRGQLQSFGNLYATKAGAKLAIAARYENKRIELEPKSDTQVTILDEAAKCVTGPRRRDYGTPDENFGRIAALWSVQLGIAVTSMQVAMCLILLKVARQSNSPKRDNLVDIAGYAQCASELTEGGSK